MSPVRESRRLWREGWVDLAEGSGWVEDLNGF